MALTIYKATVRWLFSHIYSAANTIGGELKLWEHKLYIALKITLWKNMRDCGKDGRKGKIFLVCWATGKYKEAKSNFNLVNLLQYMVDIFLA